MLQVRRCSIAAKDTTTLNSFSQENAAEKSKDGKDKDVSGRVVVCLMPYAFRCTCPVHMPSRGIFYLEKG